MRMLNALKRHLRLFANLQLMPAMEGGEETLVGGQAVIEGVMMRSPHAYCVAVRKPTGEVVTRTGELLRPSERRRIWSYPILRGVGTLGQAMALGIRSLKFSANVALEEENKKANASGTGRAGKPAEKSEVSSWVMGLNILFSVGFFIFLYKFMPLWFTTELKQYLPAVNNHFVFNIVDGIIRIAFFLGFLLVVSTWKDIRRVYEYHGAEHKVVYNFESGKPVTVETAHTFTTLHPRCGTSFLLVVMVISMVLYTLVPVNTFAMRFLIRLALLPVIAGVSFELIRYAAKRQGSLWASLVKPGLWLQKITTQRPDDGQLEIAIRALDEAMQLEKVRGGELVIA